MTTELKGLLDFVSFTHEIRTVKRAMWVKDLEEYENDSEHGYQLALTALYIIEADDLKLDVYKVMGMALVHDIIEVYSGDTPIFGDADLKKTKAERESQAIATLKAKWPKLELMHNLIAEYESRTTPEGIFLYALDKLLPMMNNYLDEGRNWQHQGVNLEDVIEAKAGKIDIDERINEYYRQIIKVLKDQPEIFAL
jgi:putative hydrolase of HD superfamily